MTSSSSSVDRRSMPASMRTSHTRVRRRTHARTHTRRSVHRRGSIVFDSSVVAFVVRIHGSQDPHARIFQSPFARDGVRGLVDAARGAIDATCSGACSLACVRNDVERECAWVISRCRRSVMRFARKARRRRRWWSRDDGTRGAIARIRGVARAIARMAIARRRDAGFGDRYARGMCG